MVSEHSFVEFRLHTQTHSFNERTIVTVSDTTIQRLWQKLNNSRTDEMGMSALICLRYGGLCVMSQIAVWCRGGVVVEVLSVIRVTADRPAHIYIPPTPETEAAEKKGAGS